ncbi:AraC-like DNA-binding protein [Kordia periserrulae]|uniref:AraC-like DNA-binding protein n=1 Tax=Kordia periserrulae TaxID=701523 RepID=A0A2T6BYH0_9FLAO|nr:helix-turn-helix domain-containing protein [Kordia periserrulae]PTX61131.1 AraC-like DNA-binding protein [Kordia periserrulae]
MPQTKRITLLLVLFCAILGHKSFSRTIIQDSIAQFDKVAFQDSLRVLAPKEFVRLFTIQYIEDKNKASASLEYVMNDMLNSNELEMQFWGYISLAKWENYNTNFNESLDYVLKATQTAKSINSLDLLLRTHIYQGDFYYDAGKYKKSMEAYLKAMRYAKETNHVGRQLAISKNIALLKLEVGDAKGSADLLEGTLKILEAQNSPKLNRLEVSIYIALTKSYLRLGDYEKSKYYGTKGLQLSNKYGDEDAKAYLYNFLGETNIAVEKLQEAMLYLDKALNYAKEIETSKSQIPFINLNRAKAFFYKKDYTTAIQILEAIETHQKRKKISFFSLEDMYEFLGKSYKALGNTEKSLFYFEKTNEVYTENDKKQNEIGLEIIKKYDLQSLKEELNQAEQKTVKTRIVLYVSIFLAILVVIGLVLFYKNREKRNQQKFESLLHSLEIEKEKALLAKEAAIKKATEEKIMIEKVVPDETTDKEVEIIDETKAKLLKKLQNFEDKELYLSKNSSLNDVAKKLKTNTSYLSKLVNAHKGKSFTAYITDLRVNYAIRRLKEDKKFRSYTIDSIARDIGFNRSESFSRAFKNKTGLYPSYYIKRLDSQNIE